MERKYFKFYAEYKDTFNLLSIRQQHYLLIALCDYVFDGSLPKKLKPKTNMVFNAIKPIIDGDTEFERIRQERIRAGKISYQKRKQAKYKQNSSKILAKKDILLR